MKNKSKYLETPWLVIERFGSTEKENWVFSDTWIEVCYPGLAKWYKLASVERIKICFSSEPVRGAIRVKKGTTVNADHLISDFASYFLGDRESYWMPKARAKRDYWWWCEIDA